MRFATWSYHETMLTKQIMCIFYEKKTSNVETFGDTFSLQPNMASPICDSPVVDVLVIQMSNSGLSSQSIAAAGLLHLCTGASSRLLLTTLSRR